MTQITRRLGAFFIALMPLVANAATTWELDWENALSAANVRNPTEGYWWHGNCFIKPGDTFNSVESSTKYARTGSKSLRMTRHSMIPNSQGHNNCESFVKDETDRHRNEVRYGHGQGAGSLESWAMGDERWFRISYYFPSDEGNFSTWNASTKRIMLAQWIGTAGSDHTHELALILTGGPTVDVDGYYGTSATAGATEYNQDFGSFNLKKDAWNDIIVRHRRSWQTAEENPTGHGIVQIWANCADWANCTPVINFSGRAAIRNKTTGWFKSGPYGNITTWDHQHVIYVDTVKMGIRGTETDAQMLAVMADDYATAPTPPDPIGSSYIYTDDFQANLPIEHSRNFLNKKCREDQYTRVLDPFNTNSGNYVFKAFLDGDVGCDESGTIRYRTQLTFGINGDNGNPLYVNQNEHTWLSFKLYVDPTTPDGSNQTFVQAQEVGESAMMVVGNDILRVIPERYRVWDGSDFGDLVENRIVDIPITPGQWYTITTRIYKRTSTQNDGEYELWLNGVKKIDLKGIITGSDLAASGSNQATYDLGPYHGDGARAGNTTYYIDNIKFARGRNNYSLFGVDGGGGGKPIEGNLVVNNNVAITSSQDPINFTVSGVNDITNCTMGGATQSIPLAVKFDYATGTSGKFAGVDTSGFTSSGVVTCYDENYIYNPDIHGVSFSVSGTSVSDESSTDNWGYTKAERIIKSGSGSGYAHWGLGTDRNVIADDNVRFDFTYSCTGNSCLNMLFDIYYTSPSSKTIRLGGTAGALVVTTTGESVHANGPISVRNYTMPDDTYRVVGYWKAIEATNAYRVRAGWGTASAASLSMDLHEVVMRKNWTTRVLIDNVTYGVPDTTPPTVENCAMTNTRVASDGVSGYVASINCTANEIGGTDYAMITTSNTAPDAAAVQAGTGAIWSSQKSADTSEIAFEAGGMIYQDLWAWVMRCDAATVPNCSAIVGSSFDDGVGPGQIKKIMFVSQVLRRAGVPFTGTVQRIAVWTASPLTTLRQTELFTLQDVNFTSGNFASGSLSGDEVNALQAGVTYVLTAADADNDPYWVVPFQITIE